MLQRSHQPPPLPYSSVRFERGHRCARVFSWLIAFGLICVVGIDRTHAQDNRYWALLKDGQQVYGKQLRELYRFNRPLHLDGRNLYDANNPVRLLRDQSKSSQRTAPYLEMTNGDILAGKIYGAASKDSEQGTPAYLEVALTELKTSEANGGTIRIRTDLVRRIVRTLPAKPYYKSGHVWQRDGSSFEARSIRVTSDELRLLTRTGIKSLDLLDTAEIHFPNRMTVELGSVDLAWRHLGTPSRLETAITEQGSQLTFPALTHDWDSLHQSDPALKDHIAIRPIWALDDIWLPMESVVTRIYRDVDELPLSNLPTTTVLEQPAIHKWPWRRNSSVLDNPLWSADIQAPQGIGMHATSKVTFAIPKAREVTTYVGLHRMAQDGGCVRCSILGKGGAQKWQSGFLTTSSHVDHVRSVSLDGAEEVTLHVDMLHDGRPAGTDPLDIRDHVDWLLPMVRVDLGQLSKEALVDFRPFLPELNGWELDEAHRQNVFIEPVWDRRQGNRRWRWSVEVRPKGGQNAEDAYEFSRSVEMTLANTWLPLAVARDPAGKRDYEVQVFFGDSETPNPTNGKARTKPFNGHFDSRISKLSEHIGKKGKLRLRVEPIGGAAGQSAGITWHAAQLQPFVTNLSSDAAPIRPDVLLTSLKPLPTTPEAITTGIQPGKLTDGRELKIHDHPWKTGFGVPTRTTINYKLDPQWKRFVAVVGLSDGWQGAGPYKLVLDGKLVWESKEPNKFTRSTPGQQIDIEIPPGHETISLVVEGDSCFGAWAASGFMKNE